MNKTRGVDVSRESQPEVAAVFDVLIGKDASYTFVLIQSLILTASRLYLILVLFFTKFRKILDSSNEQT